jgi:peptidoglycan/xylan/chitin deacetylase (PgdA/CDA1 family)
MKYSDRIISRIFRHFLPSSLLWKVKTKKKEVFLTFDDGPIPGLTLEILGILHEYGATATFFCVGENVVRYPEIYRQLIREQHATGNHSHHHLKGWKVKFRDYLEDVSNASRYVDSNLYRPPYGLITWRQAKALSKKYRVVMWSVLTRDFDPGVTKEECLATAIHGVEPGAIIVFHDNLKSRDKVLYALPRLLEYLRKEGYSTGVINFEF